MLWIIAIIVGIILLYVCRNFIRWVIFLPISYGVALLLNLLNPVSLLIQSFISDKSYPIGIVINSVTMVIDMFIIVLINSMIAPISKIGKIISCIFCFLMGVYSLSRFHSFTVVPMGMKPDAEFDLLSNVIYFVVFLASSYLLISFSSDDEFD